MKKWLLVLVFTLAQFAQAGPIAKIAVGTTHYTSDIQLINVYGLTGTASQNGKTVSLFLPITIQKVETYLKLGASQHIAFDTPLDSRTTSYKSFGWQSMYNFVNEILASKSLHPNQKIAVTPYFGFGAQGELYTTTSKYKGAHIDLFVDAALEISYKFRLLTAGLIFNIEKDFGWSERESDGVRIRSQLIFGL